MTQFVADEESALEGANLPRRSLGAHQGMGWWPWGWFGLVNPGSPPCPCWGRQEHLTGRHRRGDIRWGDPPASGYVSGTTLDERWWDDRSSGGRTGACPARACWRHPDGCCHCGAVSCSRLLLLDQVLNDSENRRQNLRLATLLQQLNRAAGLGRSPDGHTGNRPAAGVGPQRSLGHQTALVHAQRHHPTARERPPDQFRYWRTVC